MCTVQPKPADPERLQIKMAPAVAAEKEEGPSTTKNDIMIDQSQHALPVKRDASGEMKSAELATEEVLEAMDRNSDFFLNNPGRELPSFKSEGMNICKYMHIDM